MFIRLFWGIRLLTQCILLDSKAYLRNVFLKAGYHSLTIVFASHTMVYGFAVIS